MGSEGTLLPSKARRPLGAAAASTAAPAARDVLDPGARVAEAREGGFPGPPPLSASRKHRDGDVEAVTTARNYHRQRVAQNRAAEVHPGSEGLGEEVELGRFQDGGLRKGKTGSSIESRGQRSGLGEDNSCLLVFLGVWGRSHGGGGFEEGE